MKRPKILHLIPSLEIGGTERQLVGFVGRSSDPTRHHVAVFGPPGPLEDAWPNPPIRLGAIGRHARDALGVVRVLRRLRAAVTSRGIDLVHAHLGISEVLAIAVSRSVPVVAARRGRNIGFESNRAYGLLEGLGHRRADVLICNTRYWADAAERDDRWTPPTRVIYNAIDPAEFPLAPMPADTTPSVAVIANLHPYKRLDRFLRALAVVAETVPGVRATIAGDGVERARLDLLVSELRLGDRVMFLGQVADPRPVVAASHVVALTSDHEGFPNALLEAMSQGRPVVATLVGGVPELVRDGEDGFLTSGEPVEIAARLRSLLEDPALRDRMARSAHERAATFTWERLVRQTEEVYREVLARRRR